LQAIELVQRAQMIVDVSAADLEAAEAAYGPFHPTTWHFRNAWYEAMRSFDRLRAEVGGATLKSALEEPPITVMTLGPGAGEYVPDRSGRWPLPTAPVSGPEAARSAVAPVLLIAIAGQTYRVLRVDGTPLAPVLWRLTRLTPPLDDGPYYACRLRDGSHRCDCADWIYQIAGTDREPHSLCKHLTALAALGWL
jgi:hypothetical protein